MHAVLVFFGCIAIIIYFISDYRKRDAQARAEGLAPLSGNQLRKMRRAASTGKPSTPRRRPYGSPAPLVPPYNRSGKVGHSGTSWRDRSAGSTSSAYLQC